MNMKAPFIFAILMIYNTVTAQVASIPFELYKEKAVLLKLTLNDQKDSLTFFFDTGATTALIDSTAAVKLGLTSNYEQEVAGASGSKTYKFVLNQSIHLNNNIKIDSINLILENLNRLQNTLGKKFDGIIGYDMLKAFKTKINFDEQQMELYSFKDSIDTFGYSQIDFKFNNGIPIPQFPVTIQLKSGESISDTILFDSGAGLTLLINTPFKEKNNLTKSIGILLESEHQNLYSKTITQEAVIKSIQIGEYKFGENCIGLSSDKEGVSSYKNYLGILGAEFINRFNIILDYSKQKLYLKPNHLFSKKFTFPVSGIKLELQNGEIVISNVYKKSSAYQQGLRESQKIISINGNELQDIEKYRKMLEKENSIVKIKYLQADGKFKTIKLKLKRLI